MGCSASDSAATPVACTDHDLQTGVSMLGQCVVHSSSGPRGYDLIDGSGKVVTAGLKYAYELSEARKVYQMGSGLTVRFPTELKINTPGGGEETIKIFADKNFGHSGTSSCEVSMDEGSEVTTLTRLRGKLDVHATLAEKLRGGLDIHAKHAKTVGEGNGSAKFRYIRWFLHLQLARPAKMSEDHRMIEQVYLGVEVAGSLRVSRRGEQKFERKRGCGFFASVSSAMSAALGVSAGGGTTETAGPQFHVSSIDRCGGPDLKHTDLMGKPMPEVLAHVDKWATEKAASMPEHWTVLFVATSGNGHQDPPVTPPTSGDSCRQFELTSPVAAADVSSLRHHREPFSVAPADDSTKHEPIIQLTFADDSNKQEPIASVAPADNRDRHQHQPLAMATERDTNNSHKLAPIALVAPADSRHQHWHPSVAPPSANASRLTQDPGSCSSGPQPEPDQSQTQSRRLLHVKANWEDACVDPVSSRDLVALQDQCAQKPEDGILQHNLDLHTTMYELGSRIVREKDFAYTDFVPTLTMPVSSLMFDTLKEGIYNRSVAHRARSIEAAEVCKRAIKCRQVTVCFLVDCTYSMEDYITAVKDNITQVVSAYKSTYADGGLKFAFVGYRDFSDAKQFEILKFTDDVGKLTSFIAEVKAEGGDDAAEDLQGGLREASKLDWEAAGPHSSRCLIHIADAPCHGKKFHDSSVNDLYSEKYEDPRGVLQKLRKTNVNYFFYKLNPSCDMMIEAFNDTMREEVLSDFITVKPFGEIENIAEAVLRDVVSTVIGTQRMVSAESSRRRPEWVVPVEAEHIQWDGQIVHDAVEVMTWAPPKGLTALRENQCKTSYGKLSFLGETTTRMRMVTQPFARGEERFAFHAQIEGMYPVKGIKQWDNFVLKRFMDGQQSKPRYDRAVEESIIAGFLAEQWTAKHPASPRKIQYIEAFVLEMESQQEEQSQAPSKPEYFCAEALMNKGCVWKKYCNNFSTWDWNLLKKERPKELLQFSKWTHDVTDGFLMVTDLQGWFDELRQTYFLTDPSIQCMDGNRFGTSNLGPPAVRANIETVRTLLQRLENLTTDGTPGPVMCSAEPVTDYSAPEAEVVAVPGEARVALAAPGAYRDWAFSGWETGPPRAVNVSDAM